MARQIMREVTLSNLSAFMPVSPYTYIFSDVIEWETDIVHYVPRQMNVYDILCQQRDWV